jgi:hypothetical protein
MNQAPHSQWCSEGIATTCAWGISALRRHRLATSLATCFSACFVEDGGDSTCVIVWEDTPVQVIDSWEDARQNQTKLAMLTLRRAMMKVSANGGLARAPEAGATVVMMPDEEAVRDVFFELTVINEGDPEQKRKAKSNGSTERWNVPKPKV